LNVSRGQGVQGYVQPVQAGGGQRPGEPGEPDAAGGQRDLGPRVQRRRGGDEAGQAAAQQGLAAGEPYLGDAQPLHRDRDQAGHLVVAEQSGAGQPVQSLGWHAVGASQIAPVGDRYPQVGGNPAQ
jgi:hypothetical protein